MVLFAEPCLASPYNGMGIGEGINIPVEDDPFPDHLCIFIEMMAFHEIPNEITNDDLFIIPRKVYVGQVVHSGSGFRIERDVCKDIIIFKTTP